MKTLALIILLIISTLSFAQQKETFDLVTYTPPKDFLTIGWKKDLRETMVNYSFTNKENNSWCQISIIKSTVSQDYLKDIEALLLSVDLKKTDITTQQTPINNDDKNSIPGTWGISASDQSSYAVNNGINGYISRQYTFNANGTYYFYIKTFQYVLDKLLLTKETGTYQISGNNITIIPQKSIIEEWSLVLQSDKPTKRDDPFNGSTAFSNAWIYGTPCNECLIKLPD